MTFMEGLIWKISAAILIPVIFYNAWPIYIEPLYHVILSFEGDLVYRPFIMLY